MKIDHERMRVDALKICMKVLKNAERLSRHSPFRSPTKKELDKHPKLLGKQRRYSMGDL